MAELQEFQSTPGEPSTTQPQSKTLLADRLMLIINTMACGHTLIWQPYSLLHRICMYEGMYIYKPKWYILHGTWHEMSDSWRLYNQFQMVENGDEETTVGKEEKCIPHFHWVLYHQNAANFHPTWRQLNLSCIVCQHFTSQWRYNKVSSMILNWQLITACWHHTGLW